MSHLLEVADLTVHYPGIRRHASKPALDAVGLTIDAGQTVGLVGESGSGKSTLGNAVLGLVHPQSGSISFDGDDITRLSVRARRRYATRIQAVFQDPYSSFNPNRTVGQTVAETIATLPSMGRSATEQRVEEMLERVGLPRDAARRFPAEFSGGQRQRIAIARALMPSPRLIVCDESVSALDLSVQAQVLNLLADLQAETGVAYLFITHDLSVVRHVSHRVVVLHHGHVVEEGTNREVIDTPREAYTQALIAAAPVPNPQLQAIRRDARRAIKSLTTHLANSVSGATEPGDDRESLRAVAQLRHAIERRAVFEAARRHTDVGDTLEAAADALETATTEADFAAADIAFHRALLAAAGSADLIHLPPIVAAALEQTVAAGGRTSTADRARLIDLHRQIARAIEAGDDSTALSALDDHFHWLSDALTVHSENTHV